MKFQHGQEVILLDKHGHYECRATVVGRYAADVNLYDLVPSRSEIMVKRITTVPETQLRSLPSEVRAYERVPGTKPMHILDDA